MALRINDDFPKLGLDFLKRCYIFVNSEWQHTVREQLPDQGFEKKFRETCIRQLSGWNISQEREMQLGYTLDTASGVYHEVDIIARHSDMTAILEIKNRQGYPPEKNDVIVFFAKILDYLAFNPLLLLREVCPAFMSSTQFEESGLAACLGLGIHPIAPSLRPLPILIHNARIMESELQQGIIITPSLHDRFEDFCAQLNSITCALDETWLTTRCGYRSENTIVLKAVGGLNTVALSQNLRQLNADCSRLINDFVDAKQTTKI